MLASHLVNAEEEERDAVLQACAQHVTDDGVVVIERLDPQWAPEEGSTGQVGDVEVTMRDLRRDGRRLAATAHYEVGGRTWRQPFTALLLDDEELNDALARVGLVRTRCLDERGLWVEARLYSAP